VLAWLGPGFPWGTLLVNAAGSWLIGLYATLTGPEGRYPAGPVAGQFVAAGFCGGFTTFSIFSLESIRLLEAGAHGLAGAYVLASVVLWLLAVLAGHLLAQRLNQWPGAAPG
jgi:CrcB protein